MKNLNPCKHFNKEEHGGRQWKKSSTRGRVLQTSVASEGETIDFQIRKTKQSVKCKGQSQQMHPSNQNCTIGKIAALQQWSETIEYSWWVLYKVILRIWEYLCDDLCSFLLNGDDDKGNYDANSDDEDDWWMGLVANSKGFLLLIVLYCKLTANSLSWFIMILCLMLLLFFRVGPESRYLNLIWLTIMGWVFMWVGLCYLC